MQKLIKSFIVLTSLASAIALTLSIMIFQDREVIKQRTLTLEQTVTDVGINAAFPQQDTLLANLQDIDGMAKPLKGLSLHAKVLHQDLEHERNINASLTRVMENLKDTVSSKDIQLAEAGSVNRRLESAMDEKAIDLVAAQQQIERMTEHQNAQREEMMALRDDIAGLENTVADLHVDLETDKAYIARLENELDGGLLGPYPKPEVKGLVAKVIKVNKEWNSVIIDVGSGEPIQVNTTAMVHRGDNYVGLISVKDLDGEKSWCEVDTRMTELEIRVGDSVVF